MFAGFALSMQFAVAGMLAAILPSIVVIGQFVKSFQKFDLLDKIPIIFDDPAGYLQIVSPYVFILSLGLFVSSYYAHTALVKITTGFSYIRPRQNPRLENMTNYLAITAGIPMPKLGIIQTAALNSFACGRSPDTATLVVTQGLLNELDDDELRAVIAHEIVHIMNGDVQLMAMANASHGIIKLVNWLNPIQMRKAKPPIWLLLFLPIIVPIIIILAMIGVVIKLSSVLASVSRYFITSSREFIADAEAVRLTHNPSALISALAKIEGRSLLPNLDRMTDAMMIDGAVDGEYASHPPIEDRIQTLIQYGGSMIHGAAKRTDSRSFGQRRTASAHTLQTARSAYRVKSNKPLLSRINSDSKTSLLGIPQEATAMFLVVILIFLGLRIGVNQTTSKLLPHADKDYVKAVIKDSPAFVTLDLDGNGLWTKSLSQSDTYFQMRSGERPYRTGWLETSEGFLFHDRNKNKRMDGLSELITFNAEKAIKYDNMIALQRFDNNRDWRINTKDRAYKDLMVWQDFGKDGIAEAHEVFTLKALGITSLDIKATKFDNPEGHRVASKARLLRAAKFTRDPSYRKRYSKDPAGGNFYMTVFETDQARYKNSEGQIIKVRPEAKDPSAVEITLKAPKSATAIAQTTPKLRGTKPN